MHYYYGPMMDRGDWGFGLIAMAIWAAILVGIVLLIVRLVRRHDHGVSGTNVDPIDIAKARYARGDIDKAQFEQLKKDLK